MRRRRRFILPHYVASSLMPGVEGFVDRIFTGEVSGQSRAYRGSKYHQS
jgi:hypothetical protein